jgi:hypothetical protein
MSIFTLTFFVFTNPIFVSPTFASPAFTNAALPDNKMKYAAASGETLTRKRINYVSNEGSFNKSQSVPESELATVEQNLLGKAYSGDPVPKRLQRLELLAFGSTQYGNTSERWHNIQNFLQSKNGVAKRGSGIPHSVSSSLNELEKYVFKKTNPSLSTISRLDKLETKLFGKPSIGLSAESRIARLQRTLGLPNTSGEMADLPNQMLPPGVRGFNNSPYFRHIQPGMPPNTFGFGFNNDDMDDPDLSQFEAQANRMFREMQRQMQEQMRQQMQQAPESPNQMPRRSPDFNSPQMAPKPQREPIPAYNDPNFI